MVYLLWMRLSVNRIGLEYFLIKYAVHGNVLGGCISIRIPYKHILVFNLKNLFQISLLNRLETNYVYFATCVTASHRSRIFHFDDCSFHIFPLSLVPAKPSYLVELQQMLFGTKIASFIMSSEFHADDGKN